jgi:hypothetical protein
VRTMQTLPEGPEQTIRFSGAKFLLLFAPVFILAAISMAVHPEQWRNLSVWELQVFGGVVLFFLLGVLILPYRYFMHLTASGLTIQYVASKVFYTWDEIVEFRIEVRAIKHIPIGNLIVFNLTEDSPHRTKARRLVSSIIKYDVSILATFDMNAEDLINVLNEWRERYSRWGGK